MTIFDIKNDLITHFKTLNTFSGIDYLTANNVVDTQANKSFTEPSNKRWFELSCISDAPDTKSLGSNSIDRYAGFMQITICTPLESGLDESKAKFEWIEKLFKRGQFIGNNSILIDSCYLANQDADVNCYRTTIRVNWVVDIEL